MTTFTRRLQRIGSSILVSLPKEWVDANKLDKSSQVEIETTQNNLSITTQQNKKPTKEVEIPYPLSKEDSVVANITGAYLLGYDLIRIKGKSAISIKDRENIRASMRSLVAIEIIDEDAKTITAQFLLDESSVNPQKILKRMSSIAQGMFIDVFGMDHLTILQNPGQLRSLADRDSEINRQYFLLVRLIRSAIVDKRLAGTFNLGDMDILDYRLAANIIENAGDTIANITETISHSVEIMGKSHFNLICDIAKDIEEIQTKSVDAFVSNDRALAITTIQLHKKFLKKIHDVRISKTLQESGVLGFLELLQRIENYEKSWSDILDLIKPSYKY